MQAADGADAVATTATARHDEHDPIVVGDEPPDAGAVSGGQSEEMEDGELHVTTAAVGGHSPPAASGLPQDSAPSTAVDADAGPYLVVLNPLADETIFNGGVALVRWASNARLSHVDIRLSDGTAVATGVPVEGEAAADGVGSYYWAVQAAPNPVYTLEVTGYHNEGPALANSSAPFTVQDQTELTVTAPARDAVVVQGESTWIRWAATGAAATDVAISIAFARTDVDAFVFGPVPNSGEFLWVPSPALAPGRYRVKIHYSPPSQANVTTIGAPFSLRKPAQDGAIAFAAPAEDTAMESGKTFV